MTRWEIDVEMRVRKTLHFTGPLTEEKARELIGVALACGMDISALFKWSDGGRCGIRALPVETIVEAPQIVAVRQVPR